MSLKTLRPSALPLPKALSSSQPSVASKDLPGYPGSSDRQRRGGSTTPPHRTIMPVYRQPRLDAAVVRLKRTEVKAEKNRETVVRRYSAKQTPAGPRKISNDTVRKISEGHMRKASTCSTDSNGTPKSARKSSNGVTRKESFTDRKISSTSVESGTSPGITKKVSRSLSSASTDKRPITLRSSLQPKTSPSLKPKSGLSEHTKPVNERIKKPSTPSTSSPLPKKMSKENPLTQRRLNTKKSTTHSPLIAKNNKVNQEGIVDGPDVIRVGKQKNFSFLENRITSLESHLRNNQCRLNGKDAAIEAMISQLHHNALGFTAMATVVNHICMKYNAKSSSKEMCQKMERLYKCIETKDEEIARWKQCYEDLSAQMDDSISSCISEQEFAEAIHKLEERHKLIIEKVRQEHLFEVDGLKQNHANDLLHIREQGASALRFEEANRQVQLDKVEEIWRQRLNQELNEREKDVESTITDWRKKEECWEESKKNLEDSINHLRLELKDRDEALEAHKSKGDSPALRATKAKFEAVAAEVDSLKAVMEIKTEENRKFRQENIRLEEKLSEMKKTMKKLRKASQLAEDFKAQLESKLDIERKLSEENRRLFDSIEREISNKERLLRENEELHWKIRSSIDLGSHDLFSMSVIEGGSNLLDRNHPMCQSFHAGSSSLSAEIQSLPPNFGKARPISAPTGSKIFHSTPARNTIGSPKVVEVVEKTESLSWKLDYASDDEMKQPKFHSSIQLMTPNKSPLVTRRAMSQSPEIMSRSMDTNFWASNPGVSIKRSNSIKKPPSFGILSESVVEELDSLEDGKDKQSTGRTHSDFEEEIDISSSSDIDDQLVEVTTPQIEALDRINQRLVFNSSSSGLSSDNNPSSPDTDGGGDITLKDGNITPSSEVPEHNEKVHRFTSSSVIKKMPRPKYHHSNSSAMASSLQGVFMFNAKYPAPKRSGGESLVDDERENLKSFTPDSMSQSQYSISSNRDADSEF